MIEAGANEVDDDTMLEGNHERHMKKSRRSWSLSRTCRAEIGKEKFTFESQEIDHDMLEAIKEYAIDDVKYALDTDDKNVREERLAPIVEDIHAEI